MARSPRPPPGAFKKYSARSRPAPAVKRQPVWGWIMLAAIALAGGSWWLWPQSKSVASAATAATAASAPPAPLAAPALAASAMPSTADIPEASVEQLLQTTVQRDWQVRRLRGNPAVLVIEFPGLLAQGEALNRMAALLEKNGGKRDRVLDDAALQALIVASGDNAATFYLGHDYDAEGLARFFNLAKAQGVVLNASELRLQQLLRDARLLAATGPAQAPYLGLSPGALVSFSAQQADDPLTAPDESMDAARRASVLQHELSHGKFFTRADYREHCWSFWLHLLSEPERSLWRRYLRGIGYDSGNELLMVNETQALLMHTPDARDFNADLLGIKPSELEGLRARFRLRLAPD